LDETVQHVFTTVAHHPRLCRSSQDELAGLAEG
jgi:hypothetical protein